MAHVQPLTRDEAREHDDSFAEVEAMMGFVPNSLVTMARVPGLVPGFRALTRGALDNDLLPPPMKMLIAMTSSAGVGCLYCQAHTAHNAARMGIPKEKLAAIWDFETSEHFDDAERAALRLAFHSGQVPNAATADDFDECRKHYDEAQICAIVAVCSMFGYLNRWNDTMATSLEEAPNEMGSTVLSSAGWQAGKHAAVG